MLMRIRLDPGSPRVRAPTRAWMTDPATGAQLAIILYPNGTADIPVLASVKGGGDDSGGGCEDERFKYELLPIDPTTLPKLPVDDPPFKPLVPKPANVCGSAMAVVDRGQVRPVRLVARQVEPAPQPCPPGQRPPCTPIRNPGAPIGTGPVAAEGAQDVKGIDIIVKKPQQSVGIKSVGVGLGKVPGGQMLQFSQADDGTVTGRVAQPAQPGSRMVFRDASNRIVAAGVIQRDGTFRTAALSTPLLQVATACRESRGAAPVCSEPGELRKAVVKAGAGGGSLRTQPQNR